MTHEITIRPTTYDDVVTLYYTMREQDIAEVCAVHNRVFTVKDLWEGVRSSKECYTAMAEGGKIPIAVFGVSEHGGAGVPWLLGSWLLDNNMIRCCKLAKEHIAKWLTKYGKLHNATDKRNTRVLAWLQWLGFELGQEVDVNGHPFIYFSRTNHV